MWRKVQLVLEWIALDAAVILYVGILQMLNASSAYRSGCWSRNVYRLPTGESVHRLVGTESVHELLPGYDVIG